MPVCTAASVEGVLHFVSVNAFSVGSSINLQRYAGLEQTSRILIDA
jgi:hypothetical protein